MAEAAESVTIECGYCLSKDEAMQDPRVLPCSHVSCRVCLAGQLEKHKVVRCPHCKQVFDVVVDSLPTFKPGGDSKYKCDICDKKGIDEAAVMYCNSCTKLYCDKHQQFHDEVHEDHITLAIAEYKTQAARLETKTCTEHRDQIYSLGCAVCLNVFCVSCITAVNLCTNGKVHELINLRDLVAGLTGDIERLRDAMMGAEEKLSALFKKTSNIVSKYEKDTQELVEKLHETRDVQIEAIQTKYKKLEEELVASRRKTHKEMMSFMEDEVGTKLTILGDQRALMESRVRNNHLVDVVTTYKDTQREMHQRNDGKVQTLALDSVRTLSVNDALGDTEVKIVPTDNIYIDGTYLTLLKSLSIPSGIWSLCNYKGITYIGTQNCTIYAIDGDYNIKTLISLGSVHWPYGMTIYQDRIYVLVYGIPNTINVYDLSGQFITLWERSDHDHATKPAVLSDQLILPDPLNKQLTMHSLHEDVAKHIACPLLSEEATEVCAIDKTSVIVTQSSQVFRANIETGATLWIRRNLTKARSSAIYGNDLICVANKRKLSYLDIDTGNLVHEMITDHSYADIVIHGSTLIATPDDGDSTGESASDSDSDYGREDGGDGGDELFFYKLII